MFIATSEAKGECNDKPGTQVPRGGCEALGHKDRSASFNGKPQATSGKDAVACGLPLNEKPTVWRLTDRCFRQARLDALIDRHFVALAVAVLRDQPVEFETQLLDVFRVGGIVDQVLVLTRVGLEVIQFGHVLVG